MIYGRSGSRPEWSGENHLRLRLGRGRDDHGAAQSYVALAHVALKAGKLAWSEVVVERVDGIPHT